MDTVVSQVVGAVLPVVPTLVYIVVAALAGLFLREATAFVAYTRANKNASAFQQEVAAFIQVAVQGARKAVPDGKTAADLVYKAVQDRWPGVLNLMPESTIRLSIESAVLALDGALGTVTPPVQVSANVARLLPPETVAAANAAANPAKTVATVETTAVAPASAKPTLSVVPAATPETAPAGGGNWIHGGDVPKPTS